MSRQSDFVEQDILKKIRELGRLSLFNMYIDKDGTINTLHKDDAEQQKKSLLDNIELWARDLIKSDSVDAVIENAPTKIVVSFGTEDEPMPSMTFDHTMAGLVSALVEATEFVADHDIRADTDNGAIVTFTAPGCGWVMIHKAK